MSLTDRSPGLPLTGRLGIYGWRHLDPVLLASLALEEPLLMVGAHGTGKSLLAGRIARELGGGFRHYNASLLNYDDLVGIPVPAEDGRSLRFLSTPGSIWGCEFLFVDELSRCRPDLQNKLFPLVHERTVAGIPLASLRHRWAAMNPPPSDEADPLETLYHGAEPLDPALADRFSFLVAVPDWEDLSPREREALSGGPVTPPDEGPSLAGLVEECARRAAEVEEEHRERLASYAVGVVDRLRQGGLDLSPRRARTLVRCIVGVHAARLVLEPFSVDLEASAETAVVHSLPATASPSPPDAVKVRAAHLQSWEMSGRARADPMRRVLEEQDPLERILLADRPDVDPEDLSRVITWALSEREDELRRRGLAAALFARFHDRCDLTPAAWEAMVVAAGPLLEPSERKVDLEDPQVYDLWRLVEPWLRKQLRGGTLESRLVHNFVAAGFPDAWVRVDFQRAVSRFRKDLQVLGRKP